MKVYDLHCEHDHRFEGWFASEDDYITQSKQGVVECPICESRVVNKLLSAPRLNLSGARPPDIRADVQAASKMFDAIKKIVEATEDVGGQFAEEARRIHYNEAPERAIRGTATMQECQSLADEGIDVLPLPLPPSLKQPLQ